MIESFTKKDFDPATKQIFVLSH